MQRTFIALAACAGLILATNCFAQEAKPANTNDSDECDCYGEFAGATNAVGTDKPKDASALAVSSQHMFNAEDAESKFKALLTDVTLSGRWSPIKEGKLGPEKEDKYNIVNVAKLNGDSWIVNARLKYGEREFVAPIPVKVQWAGDTPVLIVDNMSMPGGQTTYSARVLFYEKTYSGTWKGGRGGGLLYGVITSGAETNRIKESTSPPSATNQPGS